MKITSKIIILVVILILLGIAVTLIAANLKQKQNNLQQASNLATLPTVNVATGQMIPGFPDFSIFPDSKIISSQITEPQPSQNIVSKSYQAYLESDKSVLKIIKWYADNLQGKGWTIITPADPTTPTDQSLVLTKDGMNASVNAEKEDDKTQISVDIRQAQ